MLPPLRRRIRRRNQKKSVFATSNVCSPDQIRLFRCFIPPFHFLCGGSSITTTQRSPFRASNPSKICQVHCVGRQTGKFFLRHLCNLLAAGAFCISWLSVWGYLAESLPQEMGAGELIQAAEVRQSTPQFTQKGSQMVGFTAVPSL